MTAGAIARRTAEAPIGAASSEGWRGSSKKTAIAKVPAASVPVGGMAKSSDPKTGEVIYVLQPKAGQYHAISSICPHAQCGVNPPQDGQFVCPCHNSRFNAATGELLQGPATKGLARYGIQRVGKDLLISDKETT
ncbi:Rieske (2Fe-2S) protein [Streptomyces sp. NPDC019396]|uniref:Rieske (2Fe-2S) protein n=1 Tax=Streptomyces sp. NPDC019396 TaxID=3154687 RepID=UPI0033C4FC82